MTQRIVVKGLTEKELAQFIKARAPLFWVDSFEDQAKDLKFMVSARIPVGYAKNPVTGSIFVVFDGTACAKHLSTVFGSATEAWKVHHGYNIAMGEVRQIASSHYLAMDATDRQRHCI